MINDRLVITDYHRRAAEQVFAFLETKLGGDPIAVSVSGESGSGKSETAECLRQLVEAGGHSCVVLGQDDYFKLPPRTNHNRRVDDISWVGPGEVHLDVLDEHVAALKAGAPSATKPLVHFLEDRIGEETVEGGPFHVVIVEGTYTSMLTSVGVRAFIDRTYKETKQARLERARDPDTDFLERVLAIEHEIISAEKARADVVILPE